MDSPATVSKPLKLLDQIRSAIRLRHYCLRTEDAYVDWAKRFILLHGKRHPRDMGAVAVEGFLTVERKVAASTQNRAKSALPFIYKEVLGIDLPWLENAIQAKSVLRLPAVLTPRESRTLLHELNGTMWRVVGLLHGTGMRLLEGLRLRVKDIEFERREILVRAGKGNKDRVTVLPENLILPLQKQMEKAQQLHNKDLADRSGAVYMPDALAHKYPHAAKAWGWQYVFPSPVRSTNPRIGEMRRHHIYEESVQRGVRTAGKRTGIVKPVTPHVLRYSFATHL